MTDPLREARHAIVQASINLANGDTVSAHGDIEQALAALAADTTRPGRCGCGGDAIIGHTHDCPRFTADTARPGLDVERLSDALATAMGGWYGDSKPFHDSIARRQATVYARLTEKKS